LGIVAWQNGEFKLKMEYLPSLISDSMRISREEFFKETDEEKYRELLKERYK